MQLHDNDFEGYTIQDIQDILDLNLIGCSGEPVIQFYNIEIGDYILIRHGGTLIALVQAVTTARKILSDETTDITWFTDCLTIRIIKQLNGLKVSGEGWYLPKTLMYIESSIPYNLISNILKQ
jgi:hypothetical protein